MHFAAKGLKRKLYIILLLPLDGATVKPNPTFRSRRGRDDRRTNGQVVIEEFWSLGFVSSDRRLSFILGRL